MPQVNKEFFRDQVHFSTFAQPLRNPGSDQLPLPPQQGIKIADFLLQPSSFWKAALWLATPNPTRNPLTQTAKTDDDIVVPDARAGPTIMVASLLPPPGITAMVMVAPGHVSGDTSNDVDIERPRPIRIIASSAGFKESQYAPDTSAALAPS